MCMCVYMCYILELRVRKKEPDDFKAQAQAKARRLWREPAHTQTQDGDIVKARLLSLA